MQDAVKILIVAPSWIGDTIMAQPLFARIKAQHPTAQIDAFAPKWVMPVLQRMPEITDVIENPFGHGALQLRARRMTARDLAKRSYDKAYILPNSLKSALIPWLANIPTRIGFTGEHRYGLLNVRHTLIKEILPLMVQRFMQLAEPARTNYSGTPPHPRLLSSLQGQADIRQKLGIQNIPRAVAFCPGAEFGPAKRWPAKHFAELANLFSQEGYEVWIFGSAKDRPIADEIAQASTATCRNLCGATRLDEAIDLIAQSDLVVCNDSGLMHVAAAVDRPLVAIYGSSSPGFTPPLSNQADILSLNLSCSPCFKRTCPLGHLDCLNQLSPERVFSTCKSRLSYEK